MSEVIVFACLPFLYLNCQLNTCKAINETKGERVQGLN